MIIQRRPPGLAVAVRKGRMGIESLKRIPGHILLLAPLVLMAAGIRFHDLGGESLWLDEGFSLDVAGLSPLEIIRTSAADVHPPLYYLLLHYWIGLFGASEAAARSLSAIFGTLSIPMIYLVGKETLGKTAGLLGAAFATFSYFLIYFAQETRSYSLMALLCLVSTFYYIRTVKGGGRASAGAYLVSTALLLYAHPFSIFTVLFQDLHYFLALIAGRDKARSSLKTWITLQIALALVFLPWALVQIEQAARVSKGFWIGRPSPLTLLDAYIKFAGGKYLLALLALTAAAVWRRERGDGERDGGQDGVLPGDSFVHCLLRLLSGDVSLLVLWLILPVLVPFAASLLTTPIFMARNAIAAAFPLFILAGGGVAGLSRPSLRWFAAGAIIALSLPNVYVYFRDTEKLPWREAVSDLESAAAAGDVVLVYPDYCRDHIYDYYETREDLATLGVPLEAIVGKRIDLSFFDQIEVAGGYWLVYRPSAGDPFLEPEKYPGPGYIVARKRRYDWLFVYRFEKKK